MKPKQKLHYAWVTCLCCSLAMFCVAGLTSTLGGMAASFLPGLLADLTGHYMVSYVGFVAIGLASLGMICLVYRHLEKQASGDTDPR